MTLHHKKHHQTYVNGLNAAEASFASAPSPKERIALLAALKFNGGGKLFIPIRVCYRVDHTGDPVKLDTECVPLVMVMACIVSRSIGRRRRVFPQISFTEN